MKTVILVNVAATLLMVGVIWIIQIVHYPLFNRVGLESFSRYSADHSKLITFVVLPLMLTEAITTLLLALDPPAGISPIVLWFGLGLVVLIWGSTFFVQVPLHSQLAAEFNTDSYAALVTSNWVRTIAWTVRGLIVLWLIAQFIEIPAT